MSPPSSCLSQFGGLAPGRDNEQKQYFRDGRLYTLQIESTAACPHGCIYCYAGSTPQKKDGLAPAEIRTLVDEAARLEIRAIDWLGGDPLIRDDWHELMLHARSAGLVNNVWTSGLLLRRREVAEMVTGVTEGGFVSVHVDSVFPDTYARLHGGRHPGAIDTIIEGVDNLLAAGKNADQVINCITYTSLQPPADAIETMRWWLREKNVRTCLTMFNPAGAGANWPTLVPGPDETRLVYRERDRLNFGDGRCTISAMDTDKFYCGTMATVTYTGDVTPCSVIRQGVGNIRRAPFREIVARHLGDLTHHGLHDPSTMPAPCNRCADNVHCFGCRANAYHYGGDANGPDPRCWVMREVE